MTTAWYDFMIEQKVIFVAFFIDIIGLEIISNTLLVDVNLLFVITLESNGLFVFGHVLPIIPAHIGFLSETIKICLTLSRGLW